LELCEDLGSVVGGLFTVEDGADRFKELGMLEMVCIPKGKTYVAGDLLCQHVVVALPCDGGEVVGVPRTNSAVKC
jgi:hypothetical protein